MPTKWKSIDSFVHQHHVDTIEFSKDRSVALCGEYELIEASNVRVGQLTVYVQNDEQHFVVNHQIPCPGILDICWVDDRMAIVAQSDGNCSLYKLDGFVLEKKQEFKVANSILLSTKAIHDKFVFSDSNGYINLWLSDNLVKPVSLWKGHEFEAWCAAFDNLNDNIIYSGGDDCNCCLWDYRQGFEKPVVKFEHPMGVCSVGCVPTSNHVLSTGCYDKYLRLWDLRMISHTKLNNTIKMPLSSFDVGGGVWRHKWNPHGDSVIIAAMHKGFVFLSLENSFSEPAKSSSVSFRPDAQLAYGIDWVFPQTSVSSCFKAIVATCSFYDNRVDFSDLTVNLSVD